MTENDARACISRCVERHTRMFVRVTCRDDGRLEIAAVTAGSPTIAGVCIDHMAAGDVSAIEGAVYALALEMGALL